MGAVSTAASDFVIVDFIKHFQTIIRGCGSEQTWEFTGGHGRDSCGVEVLPSSEGICVRYLM